MINICIQADKNKMVESNKMTNILYGGTCLLQGLEVHVLDKESNNMTDIFGIIL